VLRAGSVLLFLVVATARGNDGADARKLGAAIAKAQKKNDLLAEQQLWGQARDTFADRDPRPLWVALMESLDPARGGAFVSAHPLAERIVYTCIERNDTEHLAAATEVLGARSKAKGAGRHVGLVLRLARAVADKGKGADSVCVEAAEHGWPELAGMAATATFQGEGGDAKKAEDAVVDAMIKANDPALAIAWAQPIKKGLTTNARAVSAVTRVMQKIGAIVVQPLGGTTGGTGGSSTALAKKWRKLTKRKPIATLARNGDLQLVHKFEKFELKLKSRPGVKLHTHGGLVLALNRFGVAVRRLEVKGAGATGDEAEVPGPFDLVYRLAKGETWALTRSGVQVR
jgi:hypothetical protein